MNSKKVLIFMAISFLIYISLWFLTSYSVISNGGVNSPEDIMNIASVYVGANYFYAVSALYTGVIVLLIESQLYNLEIQRIIRVGRKKYYKSIVRNGILLCVIYTFVFLLPQILLNSIYIKTDILINGRYYIGMVFYFFGLLTAFLFGFAISLFFFSIITSRTKTFFATFLFCIIFASVLSKRYIDMVYTDADVFGLLSIGEFYVIEYSLKLIKNSLINLLIFIIAGYIFGRKDLISERL